MLTDPLGECKRVPRPPTAIERATVQAFQTQRRPAPKKKRPTKKKAQQPPEQMYEWDCPPLQIPKLLASTP